MRKRVLLGAIGLIGAVLIFGAGYLVNDLSSGRDSQPKVQATTQPTATVSPAPAPTAKPVAITGGEASAKVEIYVRTPPVGEDPSTFYSSDVGVSCNPEDFNTVTGAWIIKCIVKNRTLGVTLSERYSVNATTGEIAPLNQSEQ